MNGMRIEVAYAQSDTQWLVELSLPNGATVAEALTLVASMPRFDTLNLEFASIGVYGVVVADRRQRLNEGDRVEIYRPLVVDPMTARRRRADPRAQ